MGYAEIRTQNPYGPTHIGQDNAQIEQILNEYPEKMALALYKWKVATLDREKVEALLYAEFKASAEKITVDEIKAKIRAHENRYKASMEEIKAEAKFTQVSETLMSAKKMASLRSAF